jgi:hypothetical protein
MGLRQLLLTGLFNLSHGIYARMAKSDQAPWDETTESLLARPPGSLGRALGEHLRDGGFALLPRLEDHDVFHVVLGIGTSAEEEVELQWVLAGNGKRSLYCLGVLLMGSLVFPERLGRFLECWRRGAGLEPFWFGLSGRRVLPMLGWPVGVVVPRLRGLVAAA